MKEQFTSKKKYYIKAFFLKGKLQLKFSTYGFCSQFRTILLGTHADICRFRLVGNRRFLERKRVVRNARRTITRCKCLVRWQTVTETFIVCTCVYVYFNPFCCLVWSKFVTFSIYSRFMLYINLYLQLF